MKNIEPATENEIENPVHNAINKFKKHHSIQMIR